MSVWSKERLIEFKRKAREGKIYLATDLDHDSLSRIEIETVELREILNNVILWLSELEEAKEIK